MGETVGGGGGPARKCAATPHPRRLPLPTPSLNVLIPPLPGHKACFTPGRPCQLSVPFNGENRGGGVGEQAVILC